MNYSTPHIITEGTVQYKLGELKGNYILYDFEKILNYLNAKGKLLFGDKFKIYKEDREVIYKLCNYQIRDYKVCEKLNIDLKKGILLSGPQGCGKSSLMKLIRFITPHHRTYEMIHTRNVTFAFNHIGYSIIEQYGDHNFYCFAGIGNESMGCFFGKDCNVMGEVLLSRHELFISHRIKTHGTTILNAKELEECYGGDVRSKMKELFNLVGFDKGSRDKRK